MQGSNLSVPQTDFFDGETLGQMSDRELGTLSFPTQVFMRKLMADINILMTQLWPQFI